MHDEPLVGRRGEALGGDPGLPADVVHVAEAECADVDAGQGAALRRSNHHKPGRYRLLSVNAPQQPVKSGFDPQNV